MSKTYKELIQEEGKVYLAGGWFSPEAFDRLEAVRDIIKGEGYPLFSPKDENLCDPKADADWREKVFEGNVKGIDESSFVLAITDDKDMGTLFECGLAYGHDVPIVYYAETLGDNPFNLMLAQSGVAVIRSREELKLFLNNESELKKVYTHTRNCNFEGEIE